MALLFFPLYSQTSETNNKIHDVPLKSNNETTAKLPATKPECTLHLCIRINVFKIHCATLACVGERV